MLWKTKIAVYFCEIFFHLSSFFALSSHDLIMIHFREIKVKEDNLLKNIFWVKKVSTLEKFTSLNHLNIIIRPKIYMFLMFNVQNNFGEFWIVKLIRYAIRI